MKVQDTTEGIIKEERHCIKPSIPEVLCVDGVFEMQTIFMLLIFQVIYQGQFPHEEN